MPDESLVEGLAKGFLSSFLGSFLGAAAAKDVSSLIVNFTATGLESLGIKVVNHLRSRGNHDLEKLIYGSFLISLKEATKCPPRKCDLWQDTTTTLLEQLRSRLASLCGVSPNSSLPQSSLDLQRAIICGVPREIEFHALRLLRQASTEPHTYMLEDGTCWNTFLEEVAILFLPSFKQAYKDTGSFEKGRLAFERDVAWSTQQALASLAESISTLNDNQRRAIEEISSSLSDVGEGLRNLGDWTISIGHIDHTTREALATVKRTHAIASETHSIVSELKGAITGYNLIEPEKNANRKVTTKTLTYYLKGREALYYQSEWREVFYGVSEAVAKLAPEGWELLYEEKGIIDGEAVPVKVVFRNSRISALEDINHVLHEAENRRGGVLKRLSELSHFSDALDESEKRESQIRELRGLRNIIVYESGRVSTTREDLKDLVAKATELSDSTVRLMGSLGVVGTNPKEYLEDIDSKIIRLESELKAIEALPRNDVEVRSLRMSLEQINEYITWLRTEMANLESVRQ